MPTVETIPVASWQFFHACKVRLGKSTLTTLFKKSSRQIDRWSCDPDFSESAQRNPMDKYETLLNKLVERGVMDIARAAVDRQARIVGCDLKCSEASPDKATIEEELLDNIPALAKYQQAVMTKQPLEVIRRAARKVIQEIEEDLALIEREWSND